MPIASPVSTTPPVPVVLVADDQSEARRLARMSLEFENCRILEAANGVEALALARESRPRVVVLDILMPGPMDGFEVCRRIKADPSLAGTGVVIVSGLADPLSRQRGHEAGADAFLAKPVRFADLVEALDAWLAPGGRAAA